MPMYNLIEYSNNCSKTSRILWQYCKDEPDLNPANDTIVILMQIMLQLIRLKSRKK